MKNNIIIKIFALLAVVFNLAAFSPGFSSIYSEAAIYQEKDSAKASKTDEAAIPAASSGWYNANETKGACIKDSDGNVIQELRSYQEIYGENPPESKHPPFLLEFLNKEICNGAVLVETDSWPGIITTAGHTYVCYSYSAFVDAAEMPYANIEENVVYVNSSEITQFKPTPGTIYICV